MSKGNPDASETIELRLGPCPAYLSNTYKKENEMKNVTHVNFKPEGEEPEEDVWAYDISEGFIFQYSGRWVSGMAAARPEMIFFFAKLITEEF